MGSYGRGFAAGYVLGSLDSQGSGGGGGRQSTPLDLEGIILFGLPLIGFSLILTPIYFALQIFLTHPLVANLCLIIVWMSSSALLAQLVVRFITKRFISTCISSDKKLTARLLGTWAISLILVASLLGIPLLYWRNAFVVLVGVSFLIGISMSLAVLEAFAYAFRKVFKEINFKYLCIAGTVLGVLGMLAFVATFIFQELKKDTPIGTPDITTLVICIISVAITLAMMIVCGVMIVLGLSLVLVIARTLVTAICDALYHGAIRNEFETKDQEKTHFFECIGGAFGMSLGILLAACIHAYAGLPIEPTAREGGFGLVQYMISGGVAGAFVGPIAVFAFFSWSCPLFLKFLRWLHGLCFEK